MVQFTTVGQLYLRFIRTQFRNKSKLTTADHYNTYKKFDQMFPKLKPSQLNAMWLDEFDSKLHGLGFKPNTVWKHHKNMRVFTKYLVVLGKLQHDPYIGFQTKQYYGTKIVVTEDEISRIEHAKLPKNISGFRDIFLASFYTLLRKSDVERLSMSHIQTIGDAKFLKLTTKKTGQQVIIPVGSRLMDVMSRLKPSNYENQTLNAGIKKVFKKIGLNRRVEVMDYVNDRGSLEKKYRQVKLCDAVTIHTARRSGVTAMVRAGIPTRSIMFISGHRTEEALNAYIGISQQDNAELLLNHEYFK